MIKKYLKAKHWQIFLLTLVIPYVAQGVSMSLFRETPNLMMNATAPIMLIFFFFFFGWIWSISIGLQKRIPDGIKMKTRKFKVFLIIPMIYIPFAFSLMDLLFSSTAQPNASSIGISMAIIIPFHILSIFGMFYSFYFFAKTMKTVELQKEVTFSDFAGEFFLIWFFPIGIWIIQPKVNLIK